MIPANRFVVGVVLAIATMASYPASSTRTNPAQTTGFAPGARVLLDGHNAYPERGQWMDRIDRVLSTGTPVAIEQDLYWRATSDGRGYTSVVAHDSEYTAGAPTFEHHFFDKVAPILERALKENRRDRWPVIVLNLDFKTDEWAHHDYVFKLLRKYERFLTTATRTATPATASPLTVGPLLVLTGSDTSQRRRFHDEVPIGDKLLAFGAIVPTPIAGANRAERAQNAVASRPEQLIEPHASNYARWVNFPWSVVEVGGQNNAGDWTAADAARLLSLVERAHAQDLWIRFYTLDGFAASEDQGWTASYNFGSREAARARWQAAIDSRVDFVATDHYEAFSAARGLSRPR